MVLKII